MDDLAELLGVSVSELLDGVQASPTGARRPRASTRLVPVRRLGRTHAGESAEELPDDGEAYAPEDVVARHPRSFFLGVDGDCMNRSYPDGCDVLVDPDLGPWQGCAVVAEVEAGRSVLRRYYRGNSSLMLSADSFAAYDDMVFDRPEQEVRLVGVVVWFQAHEEERAR